LSHRKDALAHLTTAQRGGCRSRFLFAKTKGALSTDGTTYVHHSPSLPTLFLSPLSPTLFASVPPLISKGIVCEVEPSRFDESSLDKSDYETPAAFVTDNATRKAREVSSRLQSAARFIIGEPNRAAQRHVGGWRRHPETTWADRDVTQRQRGRMETSHGRIETSPRDSVGGWRRRMGG
jgi:hypothetical protein